MSEKFFSDEAKRLGWTKEELKAHYEKEKRIDNLLKQLKEEDMRP